MRIVLLSIVLALSSSWGLATETVKLRVIHADPQTASLGFAITGTTSGATLRPRQTETIDVPAEQFTLQLTDAQTSEALATQQLRLQPGHCYTVVVARETTATGSQVKPVVVPAQCSAPAAGKANATFVLASPTVSEVDVYAGWFKIISDLKRGQFEGPKSIPAGDYKVTAKNGGKNVLGPIELSPKAGRSYTIVAFDRANAAEGAQLVHHVYEDEFTTTSK